MTQNNLTAYVLAGGRSRRMGIDKLSLVIDGCTLLERTTGVCDDAFCQVKLVAGEAGKLSALGYPLVLDSPRARGPMAGVIAALEDCGADICFVTAADLFDLSSEVIASIVARYRGEQYLGLTEPKGPQPLCGIYRKSALEVLYRRADRGEFGVADALVEMRFSGVDLSPGNWRNINCPEDLKTIMERA